ncbi:MAG: hypothetical protein V4662_17700 [Verrucomicrobiota bacterium]
MTKKQIKKAARAVIKLANATGTSIAEVVAAMASANLLSADYADRITVKAVKLCDAQL